MNKDVKANYYSVVPAVGESVVANSINQMVKMR